MGKKNRGNKPGVSNPPNTTGGNIVKGPILPVKPIAGPAPKPDDLPKISKQDHELFVKWKKAMDDKVNIEVSEYRNLIEKEIDEELSNEKKRKEEELDNQLKAQKEKIESQLNQECAGLKAEIDSLKAKKKELDTENKAFEKSNNAMREEEKSIIAAANKQAEKIIEQAEKDAKKTNENYEKKVAKRDSELNKRDEEISTKEIELNMQKKVIEMRELRVSKKEEIFSTANPDMIVTLEKEIEQKAAFIEELRKDYLQLQKSINEMENIKLKTNGRSMEELINENEQQNRMIVTLQDKCNRFNDFELSEMKKALDYQPELLREIEEKNREIRERTGELTRLRGNVLELEQLRDQMDLIRTLNDHLRKELETSKRALESRVGEVCPALTEVDVQESEENGSSFNAFERRNRIKAGYGQEKTLLEVVQHVKKFAANQSEPLFYEEKDIRAFVAGLAASRFTILQGLSGTGKTSLPKIFMEAIDGEKTVIPVESSWRDRNELLGYYNDFNRKFTAKEFTCQLYRAGMPYYNDTPFFIILDEMNLSRVEYYFADFLSVLEDKKENWKIKLVDVDLRSLPLELPNEVIVFMEKDGNQRAKELYKKFYQHNKLVDDILDQKEKLELISYLGQYAEKKSDLHRKLLGGPQKLISGNTIQIPENVWFVGTANRDESTFEISDKVYDRAQVLNFNERADGSRHTGSVDAMHIPYRMLTKMFEKAIRENKFESIKDQLILRLDKILKDKFKVTFGNRIAMQLDKFVSVYVEAGKGVAGLTKDDLKREAIDYQLTNKVLRKLEYKQINKENLDELKKTFEDERLYMGARFIEWKKQNEG